MVACVYRVHFQLVQMFESYCKLVTAVASQAANFTQVQQCQHLCLCLCIRISVSVSVSQSLSLSLNLFTQVQQCQHLCLCISVSVSVPYISLCISVSVSVSQSLCLYVCYCQ